MTASCASVGLIKFVILYVESIDILLFTVRFDVVTEDGNAMIPPILVAVITNYPASVYESVYNAPPSSK